MATVLVRAMMGVGGAKAAAEPRRVEARTAVFIMMIDSLDGIYGYNGGDVGVLAHCFVAWCRCAVVGGLLGYVGRNVPTTDVITIDAA